MRAASSSDTGTDSNAVFRMMRLMVLTAVGTIIAHGVSAIGSVWPASRYVGIRPPLKNNVNTIMIMTGVANITFLRDSAYAPRQVSVMLSNVPPTTYRRVLR